MSSLSAKSMEMVSAQAQLDELNHKVKKLTKKLKKSEARLGKAREEVA